MDIKPLAIASPEHEKLYAVRFDTGQEIRDFCDFGGLWRREDSAFIFTLIQRPVSSVNTVALEVRYTKDQLEFVAGHLESSLRHPALREHRFKAVAHIWLKITDELYGPTPE